MGVDVALTDKGPEIANPIRTLARCRCASHSRSGRRSSFCRLDHRQTPPGTSRQVPLIGFAGAPWTLASYMIEGGGSKSFAEIKGLAYREPQTLHALLDKLAIDRQRLSRFSNRVRRTGHPDVRHLGRRTESSDYEEFALPYTQKIFEAIGTRVPRILYLNGCSAILESMARSGADVLSIDWRISLAEARRRTGDRVAFKAISIHASCWGRKSESSQRPRDSGTSRSDPVHILNLGHGILPPTPIENARAFS